MNKKLTKKQISKIKKLDKLIKGLRKIIKKSATDRRVSASEFIYLMQLKDKLLTDRHLLYVALVSNHVYINSFYKG